MTSDKSENNLSWRHHYLPEFYLKGFTNKGKFSVYDIKKQVLKPNDFAPRQVFFEENRNLIIAGSETNDFLETKIFKTIDYQDSKRLNKVLNSDYDTTVPQQVFEDLGLFISNLYWRLPEIDKGFHTLIENFNESEHAFIIENSKTGNIDRKKTVEFLKETKGVDHLYKSYLGALYFELYYKKNKNHNWRISYTGGRQNYIIGDNPIISRMPIKKNLFESDLIVPLSSDKLLFYTKKEIKVKIFPPSAIALVNLIVFSQSKIFAASPNSAFLRFLSKWAPTQDHLEAKEILFSYIS